MGVVMLEVVACQAKSGVPTNIFFCVFVFFKIPKFSSQFDNLIKVGCFASRVALQSTSLHSLILAFNTERRCSD